MNINKKPDAKLAFALLVELVDSRDKNILSAKEVEDALKSEGDWEEVCAILKIKIAKSHSVANIAQLEFEEIIKRLEKSRNHIKKRSKWAVIEKQMLLRNISGIPELSKISGVPYTTICSIKERDFTNASIDDSIKICRAVGIIIDDLLNIDEVAN